MLNWNRFSLRKQFLLLFLITQLLVLTVFFFYLNYNQREFYLSQLRLQLTQQGKLIIENGEVNFNQAGLPQERVRRWSSIIDARITLVSNNGVVIADSHYSPEEMDNHRKRPEIAGVFAGKESDISIRRSDTLNQEMFYLALPVFEEGKVSGVIRLSRSLKEINGILYNNIKRYIYLFFLVMVFTLLVVWWFSRDILFPLNRITKMAEKLAGGSFQERIRLKNYYNEIGLLAKTFNFMADQLEHKITEISEEKSRAEAIFKSMIDGLIATDQEQRIRVVNPAAREMLGLPDGDLNGRMVIELVRHHKIVELLQNSLDNKKNLSEEIVIQNPERKILLCRFAPVIGPDITGDDKRVIGGVVVFTDITELRRLEQIRKEFAANVSHELRTPLTSIIGYVDTLLEQEIEDPATTRRFLEIIKSEADRLELLIRDILSLARLENEDRQDLLLAADLKRVLDKTLLVLQDTADDKGIMLKKEVEAALPPVLMIPEQIEQVLINLIDNSIKYTPEGGEVKIRGFISGQKVFVEVEDNGIGIPLEDQERIFERFYRVDKGRSRSLGGTGIGLSIVKHIIRNHESTIEVESQPGRGSLFRFSLEIADNNQLNNMED